MQKYNIIQKKQFDKIFKNREFESEIEKKFYKKTYKYLKFIAWIPGLRMVWIWNSVSMNSATKNSDIDLFIVSSQNSMWFVRILVTFIFAILWLRKTPEKHAWRFCLSFFATLDWLDFSKFVLKTDPYLYFWILYFKPLLDYNNTYDLFLEKNKSWADFSEYENYFEKNKKYINFNWDKKNIWKIIKFIDNFFKKIFLRKTISHYNKIWKPYWIIINNDLLKFHNWDIRKEIAKKMW